MADVPVTPNVLANTGVTPTAIAPLSLANTYLIPNDGRTILHVTNTGGSDCTVTIATLYTVGANTLADRTVVVEDTTGDKFIGPFSKGTFNPDVSTISVTFDFITNVTLYALQLP